MLVLAETISTEEFAVIMPNFLHASVILNFNDDSQNYQEEEEDGYFWLTQFCEEIDLQLKE